ncbi:3-methyl-2-oxobutanoate hydroxymethyltransferase [Paenibacillus sp. NPDC058071]|uniref:3-methyl-2-oxobutanoate hydroxymethyltransferase n=1 Tax=Paenibacillus sp. NPDC058071 TaxID=3346326 RepID=UPI0036DE9D73
MRKRLTITAMKKMKQQNDPISVVTAYDYPSAILSEEAGVDAILVGDSLGNVVLGYDTTIPVTLDDIIYHTKAVARGARNTFIVSDMPFMTYGVGRESTMRNAARIMQEGGAHALKLEGGAEIADDVRALVEAGVPVMGHLGLTPQSVHQLGGFKVQGKQPLEAEKLMEDAKALEQAGAFAIVLELITEPLAQAISSQLSIPTIGIGAGRGCDGQVLVYHDLLQYSSPNIPKKMVKAYADVGSVIRGALQSYVQEVKSRAFPAEEHSFGVIKPDTGSDNERTNLDTLDQLYGGKQEAAADKEKNREESASRDFVSNHS